MTEGRARRLRALWLTVVVSFRADRWRSVAAYLLFGVGPTVGLLTSLWLRQLTDAAAGHDGHASVVWVVVLGLTAAVSLGVSWAGIAVLIPLLERTGLWIDRELIAVTTSIATTEHHERPDHADELELLRQQRGAFAGSPAATVQLLSVVLQLAGTAVLLARLDARLLLLPLFGIPSLATGARAEMLRQRAVDRTGEGVRRARHLFELATTPAPAKELRIFGLRSELVGRYQRSWRGVERETERAGAAAAALSALGWLIFAVGYGLAVLIVVDQAARGRATPGDVVLTLTLAATVNGQLNGLVGLTSFFTQCVRVARRYLWLTDYAAAQARPGAGGAAPDRIRDGIDLERVTFAYPGTDVPVLRDVSVHLPAGATVAVVGDNGAGKSTLVKLLCRFYEPSEGRIAVDGADLGDIDPVAWREGLASGFQDFARLELAAGQTVGVGHLPRVDDVAAVAVALDRAGAVDVVDDLPSGLGTQLGRSFTDGVELSGGQWQKLALARAMMRTAPLLLVLDEPTASLDAETEHALFERYAGAARRAASLNGGITLLVSHRFSTVRMADLILVIDGGRLVEQGSHDELMAAGGLYAELFDLQARAYR